jgi:hypothetical protein
MSDQSQRILDLEARVRELEGLRNQLIGMGDAAKWGYRALLVLAGYGGIDFFRHLFTAIGSWLNHPMGKQ